MRTDGPAILLCLTLFPLLVPSAAAAASGDAADSGITEKVTVTVSRLSDRDDDPDRVPAHVTVIDRERIERSGARTLQELLAIEAGVILFDQVGNDIQRTFDLRGFTEGSGTRVYLDGAPLNGLRNNLLSLELVPLDALERVEILRGPAAALTGGGSEAGVIRLITRRGGAFGGHVTASAGSYDARRAEADVGGGGSRTDFRVSGYREQTDGFRDSAGGDLRRLEGSFGLDLGAGRQMRLSAFDAAEDLHNPGAVTLADFRANDDAADFNRDDYTDAQQGQLALNYTQPRLGPFSLAANLFFRRDRREALTTGRSAPAFGGFFTDLDGATLGSTVQMTWQPASAARPNRLTFGVEWLDGDLDATGIATPMSDPGRVDPANPASINRTSRRTVGLYVQERWQPATKWILEAGARWDDDRIGYRETVPDPTNGATRDFSELSFKTGAVWLPGSGRSIYVSYGEGFIPPTAEELAAFPNFGSNPYLEPQDSRAYEIGARAALGRGRKVALALFLIDTRNEIVFDPDSPLGLFGANVNAGRTRRRGSELTFRGPAGDRLDLFATLTLIDSELRSGADAGNEVPLVPGERLSAGFYLKLAASWSLAVDAVYVGEQVLDNDDSNAQRRLPGYGVANTRLRWTPALRRREPRAERGLALFVDVRNLFDERYATRGIYAFDFSTFQNDVFVTPAPGRHYRAGATWRF